MPTTISKKTMQILYALVLHGDMTAMQIAKKLGHPPSSVHDRIRKLLADAEQAYIKVAGYSTGVTHCPPAIFTTGPAMQHVTRAHAMEHLQPAEDTAFISDHEVQDELSAIEFIRLNAPFVSTMNIGVQLGVKSLRVSSLAAVAGIDLSPEAKELCALEVTRDLGFLPMGTKVENWLGGTCFHMPSSTPGITRVTRHYAADDE